MNKKDIEDLKFIKEVLEELIVNAEYYSFGPAYELDEKDIEISDKLKYKLDLYFGIDDSE